MDQAQVLFSQGSESGSGGTETGSKVLSNISREAFGYSDTSWLGVPEISVGIGSQMASLHKAGHGQFHRFPLCIPWPGVGHP